MNVLLIDLSPFTEAVTPVSLGHVGAVLAQSGHEVRIMSVGASSRFSPAGLVRWLEEFRPEGRLRHLPAESAPHHRGGPAHQGYTSSGLDRVAFTCNRLELSHVLAPCFRKTVG